MFGHDADKTLINGKIEAKKMDVERLRLSQRERSKWSKIGKSFGCTSAEALSWFCAGAPIILLDGVDGGKTPYANKAELEHWLKKRFGVPLDCREKVLEECQEPELDPWGNPIDPAVLRAIEKRKLAEQ